HKIASGNRNSSCGHVELVMSAAGGGAVDINSKIGSGRQCERACVKNCGGVTAISRRNVCSCIDCDRAADCTGSAKGSASVADRYGSAASAGTSCVVDEKGPAVHSCSTGV